jgi:hypothetical protein
MGRWADDQDTFTRRDIKQDIVQDRPQQDQEKPQGHDGFKRMIYQGRGQRVRAMFDRNNVPKREQQIRNQIKSAGFSIR